jgi:hypothetical protein
MRVDRAAALRAETLKDPKRVLWSLRHPLKRVNRGAHIEKRDTRPFNAVAGNPAQRSAFESLRFRVADRHTHAQRVPEANVRELSGCRADQNHVPRCERSAEPGVWAPVARHANICSHNSSANASAISRDRGRAALRLEGDPAR